MVASRAVSPLAVLIDRGASTPASMSSMARCGRHQRRQISLTTRVGSSFVACGYFSDLSSKFDKTALGRPDDASMRRQLLDPDAAQRRWRSRRAGRVFLRRAVI
jgi:hypothetical protein